MGKIFKTVLAGAVSLTAVLLRSRYETGHFRIKRYVIHTDKINKDISFGFITDLHNCVYGNKNKSVIEALKKENLSFLILGGDMIWGKRNADSENPTKYYDNAAEFLKGADKILKIYYVFGNHETRVKNRADKNPIYNGYMDVVESLGTELINNRTCMPVEGANLSLTGLELEEQVYDKYKRYKRQRMELAETGFHILAVHSPELFEEYIKENVDLILCGHNHGGMVRLPLLGGVISRDYKLFPKYAYGEHEKNGKKMIISAGLGDHTIHFRLFNMPEIVVITLCAKK